MALAGVTWNSSMSTHSLTTHLLAASWTRFRPKTEAIDPALRQVGDQPRFEAKAVEQRACSSAHTQVFADEEQEEEVAEWDSDNPVLREVVARDFDNLASLEVVAQDFDDPEQLPSSVV